MRSRGYKKRIMLYAGVLAMVLMTVVAFATEHTMAGEIEKKMKSDTIKVLFDFTKDEDAGNADWRIDGAYSSWADNLTELGYTVDQLYGNPITYGNSNNPQDLSNYAVYIIPEPQDIFNSSESEAIREFVLNGGGLILISDHNGADRNNNGYDAVHIFNEYLNTQQYGIVFNYDDVSKDPLTNINTNGCPTITNNVTSIGIWNGATIDPEGNATGLIFYNTTNPVVVNSTYGNGRVVAIGDSSPFDDGTGQSGDTLYDGWDEYDDATLGVNMVLWASKTNGTNSTYSSLSSHAGSSPSVSYGNGNYLVAYNDGNYVRGYFVDGSTGAQGNEIQFYKYAAGIKTTYNEDGKNFTVVGFDYSLPNYHKVVSRFVYPSVSNSSSAHMVSNDANKSVDVVYGNHRILFVWINLSREQVEGLFYDTSSNTYGENFTIKIGSVQKYNVAAGYDSQANMFLVVWTENYHLQGRFIDGNGNLGAFVSFPTSALKESMPSVSGGAGSFMVTYRNGSFASATGAYFRMVDPSGNVGPEVTVNTNPANYCGSVQVSWTGNRFMLVYSDTRNGNPDVFLRYYSQSGESEGEENDITDSSSNEESPAGASDGSSMVVAWCNYVSSSNQNIEARYYPQSVPEFSAMLILAIVLVVIAVRKIQ